MTSTYVTPETHGTDAGTSYIVAAIEQDMILLKEWRAARRAFLALPPNSPDAKIFLNRLAEAENALMKGTTP